jgi:MSHA pilin protein MshC
MNSSSDTRSAGRKQAGFTLVELVVVIVIVAILGAIAMPKFFDNRAFAERGFYEEVAAAIKFAQKTAVATGCDVRVAISAGTYEARQQQSVAGTCDRADATFPTPVTLSDGQALAGSAPTGVTLGPDLTFVFGTLGDTDLGADQAVTVGPYTLTIEAASGYVAAP